MPRLRLWHYTGNLEQHLEANKYVTYLEERLMQKYVEERFTLGAYSLLGFTSLFSFPNIERFL